MSEWVLWEEVDGYQVWCRQDSGYNTIWQVTTSNRPPDHLAGYFNREELYKLKGIKNG